MKRIKTIGIAVVMALALTAFAGAGTALAAAPVNTIKPVVSPSMPVEGTQVSTSKGVWSGTPLAYSYKWQRCNASGLECNDISGATSTTYTPVAADVGGTLVSRVTAYNEEGSTSAFSKPTSKVRAIGEITEYALPAESWPEQIVHGLGSKLWFTSGEGTIDTLTTSGTGFTEYNYGGCPGDMAEPLGGETKMWFVDPCHYTVGKVNNSGEATEYKLPYGSHPYAITAGPEAGYMWFTNLGPSKIGKITPTGTITEYALPAGSYPKGIVTGSDGKLWFANSGTGKIGKMTTGGEITEYALPKGSQPSDIAASAGGDLWFTDRANNKVSKITTSGTVTEYALGAGVEPKSIVVANSGRPWFTLWNSIGMLEANGTLRTFALPAESFPGGITKGKENGLLWFTNTASAKIGSIAS